MCAPQVPSLRDSFVLACQPGAYAPGFPVLALRAWVLPCWDSDFRMYMYKDLNQIPAGMRASRLSLAFSNTQSLCAVSRRNCSVLLSVRPSQEIYRPMVEPRSGGTRKPGT